MHKESLEVFVMNPVNKKKSNGQKTDDVIDMPEAIELLRTTRPTFYRWLRSGKIKGMKIGRQWRFYREDVERFLKGQSPRIDLPADLNPFINALAEKAGKVGLKDYSGEIELKRKKKGDGTEAMHLAVNMIIAIGVAVGATDIHITPHLDQNTSEAVAMLRYRIDGVLKQYPPLDIRLLPAIIEHLKSMAGCDVHEKDKPQDGRILVKLPWVGAGKKTAKQSPSQDKTYDLRACFLPSGLGESATMRILDSSRLIFDMDELGYSENVKAAIRSAIKAPWGIIITSGPTGSGKTTLLYSCLKELDGEEQKIMSVEDPVEFILPWVTQVAVNEAVGSTFPRIAKAILNSDPDIVMIGELRDKETLKATLETALTGHLVLTQLHTDEASRGLIRMVEMGGEAFAVAEAVKVIVSQRLVRKLCLSCSVPDTISTEKLEMAASIARKGGLDWDTLKKDFRKPVGCDKCAQTGYKGRAVISEVLTVTPEIRLALINNLSVDEIRALAVGEGMATMAADGIRRAGSGETTLDEVFRVMGVVD
jgi:general secretion pathway protein E